MSLGNAWNALPTAATWTLRGVLVAAAFATGAAPLATAGAGPAKGTPAAFPITATVDVTIPTDLVTPIGPFVFDLPDGVVATDLRVDAKGRIFGGGTFRSANLTLSGRTKATRKGQTFSLKGSANVNGKPNTKFSTKGRFVGEALVGTTTLTDKARGVSTQKVATNTLLPLGAGRALLRLRVKFEGNATPSPTGFLDTDLGRFPLTRFKVKAKGDGAGGPDTLSIKTKGKGAKVTLKGTNDGANFTGSASGKVGPYTFSGVPVVFPTVSGLRPFTQDLGANSVDVEVLPDGTLAAPVSIPLNGGVFLNFSAGAIIRTRDGKLVRGPITIEVGDGRVDGAFPGSISQEITVQVQIRLRGAAVGTPELVHASFSPPAELNVDLGDATTSFGQGIWVYRSVELPIRAELSATGSPLSPFFSQGGFGNLLPGGSGGGGDGDPDRFILDGDSYFTGADVIDVECPIFVSCTGIHTASHVPVDPGAVTPPEDDREVFFPLDPEEDLGIKVKTVTIVTVDTGQPIATLGNSSGPGIGILDGVAVGVTPDGTGVFTASVIDGDRGLTIQIDTDVKDAFEINWTGCLPNGDAVAGGGVPQDGSPPPDEEGSPAGPFVGHIEVAFKVKPDSGRQAIYTFRRLLVSIVGPGGTVGYGNAPSIESAIDLGRAVTYQIPIEGYTSSTGTLGDALGDLYTFEAGHRTLCVRQVCPKLVPVVADLTDDALVFFGGTPFAPTDRIPLPGRTGRVKAAGRRIYTTNDGRLTCVDPAGRHVVGSRKIKGLGDAMDVSPLHECIYVATERGEFIAIDPVTLRDKWKIDTLPATFLGTVDVSPDGGRAVVTAPLTSQLIFIDLLRRTVERIDAVPNAQAAAWHPDGSVVAVTDINGGRVIFVDPNTGAQISTSTTGQTPVQIAYAPDGSFVGVGNFNSDTFAVVNTDTGAVTQSSTPVDGANGLAISPVEIDEAIRILGSGFNDNTVNVFEVDLDTIIRRASAQTDFQPGNGAWIFDEFESFR